MTRSVLPAISEQSRRVLASFDLSIDPRLRVDYHARGWWSSRSVLDMFDEACRRHSQKPAIVNYRSGLSEPVRLTYAEVRDKVERVSDFLLARGVSAGDVVSVQLPNWWEFPVIALATLRVGAVLNPVLPIFRAREVAATARTLQPKVLFIPRTFRSFEFTAMVSDVWPLSQNRPVTVVVGGPDPTDRERGGPWVSFEREVLATPTSGRAGCGTHTDRGVDADLVSDIQFTSGTTGEPKGVGHIHATLVSRVRALFEAVDVGENDVAYMPSPITHSTGLLYGVFAPLTTGMTTVLQDVWDVNVGIDAMRAERVTWTFVSTTFLVDLLEELRRHRGAVESLRFLISGGAVIPPALIADIRDHLQAQVLAAWGMTENGAVTFTRPQVDSASAPPNDGSPCSWMSVRILDATDNVAETGDDGHLVVRGASQMVGYVRRAALLGKAFDDDHWFRTGDLARQQVDGSIRITGRLKDVIVRGGENIPVNEIEKLLFSHPDVLDVALVSVPDDRLGERICAVVEQRRGALLTLGNLTSHLASLQVSKSYWPERLEFLDAMPRTASGKIRKDALREGLLRGNAS